MLSYLNFGALRSFVFAFFSFAKLKSEIEFSNCERSPVAGGGAAAAPFGGGGGGGGGGGAGAATLGGGGDTGVSGISTLACDVNCLLGDVCVLVNCNGSTLIER